MADIGRIRRNLTDELIEGATDGALKKPRPNTSNIIFDVTDDARTLLVRGDGFSAGYGWSSIPPPERTYTRGYVRGA